MTGGLRVDLHVHSRFSPDSRMEVEQIAERVSGLGLGGFALTDHNSVAGHPALSRLAERFPRLLVIPGVEVSTREGHLLLYGVSELPPARRPVIETIEWARSRGAVSVLAHPFRWAHGVGRGWVGTAPVDGIEALNGHTGPLANSRAELAAAQRRLALTGGSDAHELRDIGRAFTELPDEVVTLEGALGALRRGATHAGGRAPELPERFRLSLRTVGLRAMRGFRPI